MDIAVLVKGVPDFREGKVQFKEDNTLNRGATPTVLNPNDRFALEAARELKVKHGATVHVISMGPPNYTTILQEAMEVVGDQLYLLSDFKLAASDTWATAHALSAAIRKIGDIEMVLAGFKSADGETGQTGPQTSLMLDMPILTHTMRLTVFPEDGRFEAERLVADEIEVCEGPLPAFIVTDPAFEAEFTKASERLALLDIEAEQAERVAEVQAALETDEADPDRMETWDVEALGIPEDRVGLKGSPTIVRTVDPIPAPPSERDAEILDGDDPDDLAKLAEIVVEKGGLR